MSKGLSVKSSWTLRKRLLTLYFALRDRRTPWYARFTAFAAILYLVSPIDIIPDFIPFVGYADDLVIVPALLSIAFKILPPAIRSDARRKAAANSRRIGWIALVIIILIVAAMVLIGIGIVRHK